MATRFGYRDDLPIALGFANTAAVRGSNEPGTQITDYIEFISLRESAGVGLGHGDIERLARAAVSHPEEAEAVAVRARRLRLAVHGTFEALARGRPIEPGHIDLLDREWREARSRQRLVKRGARFAVQFPAGSAALERPLWMIAASAAELLLSDRLDRVKQCDAPDCTHLFLDTSRNRSRRWCDMAVCGNRMKQRRYARRHGG